MSNSVTVNVDVTTSPFGVTGSISVDESVFELSRKEFSDGAGIEINQLSRELHDLALSEYDRRNA